MVVAGASPSSSNKQHGLILVDNEDLHKRRGTAELLVPAYRKYRRLVHTPKISIQWGPVLTTTTT